MGQILASPARLLFSLLFFSPGPAHLSSPLGPTSPDPTPSLPLLLACPLPLHVQAELRPTALLPRHRCCSHATTNVDVILAPTMCGQPTLLRVASPLQRPCPTLPHRLPVQEQFSRRSSISPTPRQLLAPRFTLLKPHRDTHWVRLIASFLLPIFFIPLAHPRGRTEPRSLSSSIPSASLHHAHVASPMSPIQHRHAFGIASASSSPCSPPFPPSATVVQGMPLSSSTLVT